MVFYKTLHSPLSPSFVTIRDITNGKELTMDLMQTFFLNVIKVIILNLTGIVTGDIASAAQLFEDRQVRKGHKKQSTRTHSFRNV